jgi:hypothetical protein
MNYYNPWHGVMAPQPCHTCGHCPTCGRGGVGVPIQPSFPNIWSTTARARATRALFTIPTQGTRTKPTNCHGPHQSA